MLTCLGIDFSGGAAPWRDKVRVPTVWIARLEEEDGALPRLAELIPAQSLPGAGTIFSRLVARLREADYATAAIDAPFSIPAEYLPPGGRADLLARLATLRDGPDRPFPTGPALIELAEAIRLKDRPKPLRRCEAHWAAKRVNTRSTLWWKPRGGAPFAAACLALIARTGRPCWPWATEPNGLLVEAFPAAQLRHWGLDPNGYTKIDALVARRLIVADIDRRLTIGDLDRERILTSPDALDAVLAGFAAYAVAKGRVGVPPEAATDGWIAVLDGSCGREPHSWRPSRSSAASRMPTACSEATVRSK